MSLEYYFEIEECGQPKIDVSQPVPESFLIRNSFNISEIRQYLGELHQLPWRVQQIEVAGKYYLPKRETLGFADNRSVGLIKNRSFYAIKYPPYFNDIRSQVQKIIMNNLSEMEQTPEMNYTWGNRYRNGCDKVGKHKDDERGHSKIDPIVSVSFGEYRHFDIFDDYKRITRVDLGYGDIFLMMPKFQELYYHAVPTQKIIKSSRINLTFRTIENGESVNL